MIGNMVKDEGELEEFEMLLNEIPQATSHRNQRVHVAHDHHAPFVTHAIINGMCAMYNNNNEHDLDHDDDDPFIQIQYPCVSSPVSGFSLQSNGSSPPSLFSAGHALSGTGSPTPPPFEDLKFAMPSSTSSLPNRFCLDSDHSITPDSSVFKNANETLIDQLGLCANFSKMCITGQQHSPYDVKHASMCMNSTNRFPFFDCSLSGNSLINVHKHVDHCNFKRDFLDCTAGHQSHLPWGRVNHDAEMSSELSGFDQHYRMATLFGSRQCAGRPETMLSQLYEYDGLMDFDWHYRMQQINDYNYRGDQSLEPTVSLSGNHMLDSLLYAQRNGMSLDEETGVSRLPGSSSCTNLRPYLDVQNLLHHSNSLSNNARAVPLLNARFPQGDMDAITSEGSFIIQGEGVHYVACQGSDRSSYQSKAALPETGFAKHLKRSELDTWHQFVGTCGNPRSARTGCSFLPLSKYNSLAEARGYIYLMAKDQHGCRFLQRMFDEGTAEDVQVIFNEIIDHVVELMMNPFGNYLMQKFLDVCNEEQRMQILLIITEVPGQLVRISLNTHGTRAVQKLIETLKTRQQIALVVSALEPGFLALIKDLNGNHVVQRCLLCLSNEDNKKGYFFPVICIEQFIFVAAAKYCVDIATHQHGCCVLQRCINHASGQHREKLIAEISANALLLAQDQFGNYVVQFILDLRIPCATTSVSLQFEGNYVHLSRQKFGSHVVEKCLSVFSDENRSRIIHELLSAPHFEHLLQDPHANYVVQSALRQSEGHAHNILVEAIESHKAISRNSPYSKKIFSQKLLKK